MKYKQSIIIVILILVIGVLGYLYLSSDKKTDKGVDVVNIDSEVITATSSEGLIVPSIEENSLSSDSAETPLYIKSLYQKNGEWFADVDYVTKITPLAHMKRKIEDGSCAIPNMSKNQMLEYAKSTLSKNIEQNNLLSAHCGYDWQNIRGSDGSYFSYYINVNPRIRTLSFASDFNTVKKYNEACGGNSFHSPESIKNDLDLVSGDKKLFEYSFDIYNTKGYFVDLAIINNGVIKEFAGEVSCPG